MCLYVCVCTVPLIRAFVFSVVVVCVHVLMNVAMLMSLHMNENVVEPAVCK